MDKKAVEKETVKLIQNSIITVIVVLLFFSITSNIMASTRKTNPIETSLNSLYRTISEMEERDSESIYLNFGNYETGMIRAYFGFKNTDPNMKINGVKLDIGSIHCDGDPDCICYCRLKLIGEEPNWKFICFEGLKCISFGGNKLSEEFVVYLPPDERDTTVNIVYLKKFEGLVSVSKWD